MRKTLVTIATILIYMLLCYANIVAAACPQTLEPVSFWFETDPPFSEVDQITIAAELANATASNFVFSPTGSNNFQLWSSPGGIATMPVTVNIAPSGVVVPGQSFSFELVVDVSSLPSTENRLCFRVLEGGTFGTLTSIPRPFSQFIYQLYTFHYNSHSERMGNDYLLTAYGWISFLVY